MGIQFNNEVSGAIGSFQYIAPSMNTLTPQSTMHNLNIDFMSWKELIQKPRGNILTGPLTITVSTNFNERVHDQCKNQMNDEMKISLSLVVIINNQTLVLQYPHQKYPTNYFSYFHKNSCNYQSFGYEYS